jgi:hypothetical protein
MAPRPRPDETPFGTPDTTAGHRLGSHPGPSARRPNFIQYRRKIKIQFITAARNLNQSNTRSGLLLGRAEGRRRHFIGP